MHRASSAFLHPFATSVVCGAGEPFHRSSRNTSSLCAATLVSYHSSITRGKALAFPPSPCWTLSLGCAVSNGLFLWFPCFSPTASFLSQPYCSSPFFIVCCGACSSIVDGMGIILNSFVLPSVGEAISSVWDTCRTGSASPRAEPERGFRGILTCMWSWIRVKWAKPLGNIKCCGTKRHKYSTDSMPSTLGTEMPNSVSGVFRLMRLFCPSRSAC